jgi:spore coat protein CotF
MRNRNQEYTAGNMNLQNMKMETGSLDNVPWSGNSNGGTMQEKAMVNDALASIKSSLTTYTTAISDCANPNLRSTLQQIRNGDETSQYELFKIAQSKGYYQPATMADDNEVQQIKSQLGGQGNS